ncbi:MAG: sigma-54-dependent transcriptional regulator [Planctomycetaceae bacterium]
MTNVKLDAAERSPDWTAAAAAAEESLQSAPETPLAIQLLLVDDEDDFRETAADYFRRCGYHVTAVPSGKQAIEAIRTQQFEVAVLDVHMPGLDGVALLPRLLEEDDELQILMLTGGATVDTAVASLKAGAIDYVTKPIRLADLDRLIRKAARTAQLQRENSRLRQLIRRQTTGTQIVGNSPEIKEVFRLIERVATTDLPVLIEGESGTGKELVARQVHAMSSLADRPIVVVNCAALPEHLLESEFFGHEKGAFTGATAAKPGLFEIADGGTLFIDELGEMAMSLQAKILRVLEDGVIRRVGSVKERQVRVRVIAATNRSLADEVAAGRFREDLYYRVNVLRIVLPPLRTRPGDLELLIKHFLGPDWSVDGDARAVLLGYHWPGNVRQLINALQRAKLLADDRVIRVRNLPPEITNPLDGRVPSPNGCTPGKCATSPGILNEPENLASLNRRFVQETLARANGNKAEAARLLGIHRRSLYRLLERFSLE